MWVVVRFKGIPNLGPQNQKQAPPTQLLNSKALLFKVKYERKYLKYINTMLSIMALQFFSKMRIGD